jgi:hypothetical protein
MKQKLRRNSDIINGNTTYPLLLSLCDGAHILKKIAVKSNPARTFHTSKGVDKPFYCNELVGFLLDFKGDAREIN